MKVDVLIPAYNAGKTIEKTILSVIHQSCSDWTLTILDDGSTDKTRKICQTFCERDQRIKYVYQENQGLVAARKRLLKEVRGDYFTFLDADDLLHCDMLSILLKVAKDNEWTDIVMIKASQNVSRRLAIGKKKRIGSGDVIVYDCLELLENFMAYPRFTPAMHGKMFAKKLASADLDSIPKLFLGEDTCFNATLFAAANKVTIVDEVLYYYRAGGGSSGYYPRLPEDIGKLYAWRKEFITQKNLSEQVAKNAVVNCMCAFRARAGGVDIDRAEILMAMPELIEDMREMDFGRFQSLADEYLDETKVVLKLSKEKEALSVKIKQFLLRLL